MPEDKKPTKSMFGGFSDPPFITTDPDEKKTDPYIKAEVIPSRYTGQNFKIARPKKGHGKDAYFSKDYLTFASAEQNGKAKISDTFVNPGTLERKAAAASKEKNIVPGKDFRYASPPKRSTGSGSPYGTFDGKPIPHQEDHVVLKRGEPAKKVERKTPKNIITMPAKKGTYGFIGTTFSKITGPEKADEFEAIRKKEREAWEASKKKMIHTAMFKTTIKPIRFFDQKGSSGVSAVYDHFDPPEDKKASKKKAAKPKEDKSKIEGRPVFKYSSAPRSGTEGCLNKFPNSREDKPDPYDSARLARKEAAKTAKPYLGGTWKPVSGPKQAVVKSLLRKFY